MEKKYTTILFYRFAMVKNPEIFRDKQRKIAEQFGLKGRILVASEGVNATVEGETKKIKSYIRALRKQQFFKKVVFKESLGTGRAFTKLQVKVRPEIVTLGVGKLNIKKDTAPVVSAKELEAMYKKQEDFVVLDLRNEFEVQAGYFEKTISLNLKNFRDLPRKLSQIEYLKNPPLPVPLGRDGVGASKKVVAVCTGGIRCEKATCLLKKKGFKNLYQLEDGIHTYIKKYPGKHFKGSLFVFDNRMTTPVVDTKNREVVGKCFSCATKSEEFYNDDRVRPSIKIICCDHCILSHTNLRRCIPA